MGKQEQNIFRTQRSAIEVVSASSAASEQPLKVYTFQQSTLLDRDIIVAKIATMNSFINSKGLLTITSPQRKLYLKRLKALEKLRLLLDKEVSLGMEAK